MFPHFSPIWGLSWAYHFSAQLQRATSRHTAMAVRQKREHAASYYCWGTGPPSVLCPYAAPWQKINTPTAILRAGDHRDGTGEQHGDPRANCQGEESKLPWLSRMTSKSSWLVCPQPKMRTALNSPCCLSLTLDQPHRFLTQSTNMILHAVGTPVKGKSCGKSGLLVTVFGPLGKNPLVPVPVLSQTYYASMSKSLHHQAGFSSHALRT